MENLFSINIAVNDKNVSYHVFFDHEKYIFEPEAKDRQFPSFSFKREHDEWHDQDSLSPQVKQQAITALEKYLLAQH